MNHLTRFLYRVARLANRVRVTGSLVSGNPRPFIKHAVNKQLFRIFGRFLTK